MEQRRLDIEADEPTLWPLVSEMDQAAKDAFEPLPTVDQIAKFWMIREARDTGRVRARAYYLDKLHELGFEA